MNLLILNQKWIKNTIVYGHLYFITFAHLNVTLSMLTCEYKQVINYEEHLNTIIIFLIITCSVETNVRTYTHLCTHVDNKHF